MYSKDFGFLGLYKINYWHFLSQDRISKVAECKVGAYCLLDLGDIWEQGSLRLLQSSWSSHGTGFWRENGGEQRHPGPLCLLQEPPWGKRDHASTWDLGRVAGGASCLPQGQKDGESFCGRCVEAWEGSGSHGPRCGVTLHSCRLVLLTSSNFMLNAQSDASLV